MPIPLALLFDFALGDPPNRLHTTIRMGSLIAFFSRFRPRRRAWLEMLYGSIVMLVGWERVGGIPTFGSRNVRCG